MPATARQEVFARDEVGFYHTMSRIVARRFLMGVDELTGNDFSHRKAWLDDRIRQLLQVFMVDSLCYAIMDNHFHLYVRVRPDMARTMSDWEVVRRSLMISPGYMPDGPELEEPEEEKILELVDDPEFVQRARERLSDISWFMKCLKEPISRRANSEEEVEGCFWQGRFKMSRMLDASAVLLCALYVDLNEVRAGVAETPEDSINSSIGHRIMVFVNSTTESVDATGNDKRGSYIEAAPAWLSPIDARSPNGTVSGTLTEERPVRGQLRASNSGFLDVTLQQYLNLCDTIGRMFSAGKRGKIAESLPAIAARLLQNKDALLKTLSNFHKHFPRACGQPESMEKEAARRGLRSIRGISMARQLLSPA